MTGQRPTGASDGLGWSASLAGGPARPRIPDAWAFGEAAVCWAAYAQHARAARAIGWLLLAAAACVAPFAWPVAVAVAVAAAAAFAFALTAPRRRQAWLSASVRRGSLTRTLTDALLVLDTDVHPAGLQLLSSVSLAPAGPGVLEAATTTVAFLNREVLIVVDGVAGSMPYQRLQAQVSILDLVTATPAPGGVALAPTYRHVQSGTSRSPDPTAVENQELPVTQATAVQLSTEDYCLTLVTASAAALAAEVADLGARGPDDMPSSGR